MQTNNGIGSKVDDWTYRLFVKHPHLFLPVLKNQKPKGESKAIALERIFEEFNVPPRAKILDFSCGIGTHSINLAKKGYQVVGCDPSPLYVEIAKQTAIEEIVDKQTEIRFYQVEPLKATDVLLANDECNFNGIIIFHSLGFLGEAQDIQILKNISKLAAANCILVIET